ncbi:MAG: zinc-ribbon domain-containing protein [Candidatus Aegiribacteria sp.]|nr:zinc-ribbon domain-containing protein [Candidatus Aegiribacteria sp.]
MEYPRCPSCGYELYDRTDQCPFCGSALPRRSLQSIGVSTNHRTKIIALVAVVILISGAVFTYYLAMWSEKTAAVTEKISEQHGLSETNERHCVENMYRILDAENEYFAQNGCYMDNIDELARFDSTLNLVCPENGESYRIHITKQSVAVLCSIHGEI